jgi:hypothetical protein
VVAGDADQHVGVVRQERPVGSRWGSSRGHSGHAPLTQNPRRRDWPRR